MTQRSAETFRLDAQHLEFIRMAGAAFDPPSDNKSFIARTLLTGLRALLMTRRMPRWMADLQEKLTVCADVSECTRDSVMDGASALSVGRGQHAVTDLLSASAAEAGRRDDALGVRAKRPPRKFTAPRVRAVSAVEVPLVAWTAPFYGARPFVFCSRVA